MRMTQQPAPDHRFKEGSFVIIEDTMIPGIVIDDDIENPIRLIQCGDRLESHLVDEILLIDRDLFELTIAAKQIA
jgi:hypothetical protein